MVELNFSADAIEPLGVFDVLPVGEYVVVVSETDMKDASTGKGRYLQIVFTVIDGEYKGRKIWDRLNIDNESTTAQEIAQRALSSICRAVKVMHPQDSDELKDIPLIIVVGIRPAKGDYQASNVVKGYKNADGSDIEKGTPSSPAAATKESEKKTPAAPAAKKKPWEKK
jgi:hypothetical protein